MSHPFRMVYDPTMWSITVGNTISVIVFRASCFSSYRTIYGTQGRLPTTQFSYREGLGTFDAFLCVTHTLQSTLESAHQARILQINFSAVFDRVNHQRILYKFCSPGIGCSALSIMTQLLSNRAQHVMADGYRSNQVNIVSGLQ